uniref:CUE domain-containing protein n=1 Tax=Kwoniella bestiolae CBS 10118 TaxID=1296100 RepID=A0A1B9GA21_9TREE|nr:hypothetical protein I302_02701 [Kwoniella bestiolae CBS 10118]OCF27851.1 hypothetical protein I302_02701 [Kwoniella bestiolae CBS 10118]
MSSPPKPTSPAAPPAAIAPTEQHAPPPGPPPPSAATQQPAAAPPTHPDTKVNELHQMFPTVEVSVIELILETSQGSTDRAIEQLLGMTDPEFRSDELGGTREDAQVDLDAQFARSLQMADEESYRAQQAEFHSRVNSGNNPPPPGSGGLPYQPRIKRGGRQQPYSEQDLFYQNQHQNQNQQALDQRYGQRDQREGENPPGMLAFEERVEKFAEAGKQTFNSLFSKAKAKYSEFQTQQAQNRANSQSGSGYVPENLSPSGDRYTRPPGIGGNRGGEQNRNLGGGGGLWDDRPSLRSESISSQSTFDAPPQSQAAAPLRQSSNRWQPSDAYDDPLPPARTMSGNRIEITGSGGGRSSTSPSNSFSPDKQMGKIDPAKLGILPKKRVDLLSTSPSSSTNPLTKKNELKDDDDDPNPSLPNAPESLVSKIPPTPPAGDDRYRLEDSDDELEYTK